MKHFIRWTISYNILLYHLYKYYPYQTLPSYLIEKEKWQFLYLAFVLPSHFIVTVMICLYQSDNNNWNRWYSRINRYESKRFVTPQPRCISQASITPSSFYPNWPSTLLEIALTSSPTEMDQLSPSERKLLPKKSTLPKIFINKIKWSEHFARQISTSKPVMYIWRINT